MAKINIGSTVKEWIGSESAKNIWSELEFSNRSFFSSAGTEGQKVRGTPWVTRAPDARALIARFVAFTRSLSLPDRNVLMSERHFGGHPTEVMHNLLFAAAYDRREGEYGGGSWRYDDRMGQLLRTFDLNDAAAVAAHLMKLLERAGRTVGDIPAQAAGHVCAGMPRADHETFVQLMAGSVTTHSSKAREIAAAGELARKLEISTAAAEKAASLFSDSVKTAGASFSRINLDEVMGRGSTAAPARVAVVNDSRDDLPPGLLDDLVESSQGAW